MRTQIKSKASKFAVAALMSTLAVAGATVATTTSANAGVTTCNSTGGRQEAGALIGAVVGGVIGNQVAKNERGLGTVAGAGLGAAAGSAIGCNQQDKRAAQERAGDYQGKNAYVAQANVNVRSSPNTGARKVSSLYAGQRFQSLGASRNGQWIIVGRNGRQIGYVASSYVSPVGYERTNYRR